ncbi:MAG: NAD(P)/FAD-dependent oxidoreductase [Thaumarchaeota archaeon]|nr:NAD(P)/FAD-dependent oxidoreductase [Nitrososphaerota archaeon]
MSRVPGMIFILVSFIPWIIYWILCSLGLSIGVLISLAVAAILVIYQARLREFNPMDLMSLAYFAAASAATYILDFGLFVEKPGFLGYLALFIMALISIAAGRPFTLQASKRDYPEVYWRDRTFLLVNDAIAGMWSIIFLLNSIISIALVNPYARAASNALIAIGIILSILSPEKLSAYLLTRNFRRCDWRVKVDPKRPKAEDEYDVIIVGSGIGGLTCGALLSKRGYKTLILEQHYLVGGYCTSFSRSGFTFNVGVSDVSGLWERGPITRLLRELGLEPEELFVRNRMRYVFRGKAIDAGSLDELVEKLSEMFPSEEENIQRFLEDARMAYDECYMEADVYGTPLPAELIVKVFGSKKLLNYPKDHPHFYDWMNKTFKEKLDEYFKDEDLKNLLCALIGYIGAKPDKVSASSALTATVSYYIHGGYFPRGGAQNFADTLRRFIEDHGGKVMLRCKVNEILVEDGRVRGVKAGERMFKAPIVVANANAKTTFLELVGEKFLDKGFIEYIKGLKMSPSCFAVFLGLDVDLRDYPSIIVNLDNGYYLVINSNADPSLAPEGKASITILTEANYYDFPERGTREYIKLKRMLAEKLIEKAEKIIQGLIKHIVVMDIATPKTYERYTSMPEGAIYSFDQSIYTKRPYFKTSIKGLYLASASTFPGGGIEAVTISGIICANDICGWKIK